MKQPPKAAYDFVEQFEHIAEHHRPEYPDFNDYRRYKGAIDHYEVWLQMSAEERKEDEEAIIRLFRKMDGGLSLDV